MRPVFLSLALGAATLAMAQKSARTPAPVPARATLTSGWSLTPVGTHQKTSDMILGGALSPDKGTLALVCGGYNDHFLYLADGRTGAIRQSLPLAAAFNGLTWHPGGQKLYVSGGGRPEIYVFEGGEGGKFAATTSFAIPKLKGDKDRKKGEPQAYLSGLALSLDGRTLFAANLATDTVYALDVQTGAVLRERKLDSNAHPYCLKLSPGGETLYATQGALRSVVALSPQTLETQKTLTTDAHPNDLAFSQDGRLFVSCANSDTVCVFDPESGQLVERIDVRLTPNAPAGALPDALSVSPDGKRLYVACAGNNAVAVVNIAEESRSAVEGFLPTGWYPTWVLPTGGNLLIGSGKGMGTGPNSAKFYPDEVRGKEDPYFYIARQLYGILSATSVPTEKDLEKTTAQVLQNTPYRDAIVERPAKAPKPGTNPVPSKLGEKSPIQHILYIIKENRTYDQVLGDLEKGNGDKSLCLFGEKVTPNIHQLARTFVTLDNTYCSGEVSGNGHPWSTAAYGTDIGERGWMQAYGDHADWPLTDLDLFPPVGRLWDVAEKHGQSFASYYFTWTTPNTRRNMPSAWAKGFDTRRDFENADIYLSDLKKWEISGKMPSFAIMSLREDHTEGTTPGKFTPQACVASNDQGVGMIVAGLSRSKFWKSTAVFIIQDDAQDGPDHVDAHRTEALVVSPYTRTGKIDSTAYTTCSLLRTMELILSLPPMSEYDAAATPMYNAFTSKPDLTPYSLRPAQVDLLAKNTAQSVGAAQSARMDFSRPDHLTEAQVAQLNRILWADGKGADAPYPVPIRRRVGVALKSDD